MVEQKKETVGSAAYRLLQQEPDDTDAIELEREMHKEYEQNIFACIERHKNTLFGDFYVVVITKKEPLMKNVLRQYYCARQSCPTPDYDQTVYRYNRFHESIDFLWVIPSRETCFFLKNNALTIVPEQRDLCNFVLDFEDGTLMKLAKRLNNEE